ncbi:hypothetical protein MKX08_004809 [Trichoderma sp. CBMAI-0020]|nr:hypothetical protein MKX08_004809 [Trichoderma sp. CBMAI-0020]
MALRPIHFASYWRCIAYSSFAKEYGSARRIGNNSAMARVHVVIQASHSALGPVGRHPIPSILMPPVHTFSDCTSDFRHRSWARFTQSGPIHANCITYETGRNGVLTKVLDRVVLFIDDAKHVQLELSNS